MALPVTIPNTFANATSSIPLSQLDTNFSTLANAVNGLNSGSETLANLKATTANVGVLTVTGNATIGDASTDTVTLNSTLTANTAVIFAAGTSAAPSITTTGDLNTGIFFPAADTIAFAEGGAEAMRIDSSGNVGIGTTAPSSALEVYLADTTYVRARENLINKTVGYQIVANGGTPTAVFSSNTLTGEVRLGGIVTNYFQTFYTSNSERMRIDSSGNVGVGITPSAWRTSGGEKVIQFDTGSVYCNSGNDIYLNSNWYLNSSAQSIYIETDFATSYSQQDGKHIWYTAPSGTAGNAITFTQAMTLDASGNLGIGTSSPSFSTGSGLAVVRDGSTAVVSVDNISASTAGSILLFAGASSTGLYNSTAKPMAFFTNATERARITSDGLLFVNTTTNAGWGGGHRISRDVAQGTAVLSVDGNTEYSALFYDVEGGNYNAAATAQLLGRNTNTLRSINAGGTVNASGADYAEYMTKAGDFVIAKGDICGVNAEGKLTNVFADAIAFVVKSTDPSYVGGDVWGNEDAVGKKPREIEQRIAQFDEDGNEIQPAETDEEFATRQAQYQSELTAWAAKFELERQKVDRVAFSGQVPVNVTGASPGQYIVPVENNGGISGIAVNEADMTMAQYVKSVGKVIAIQADGRAKIIVKVA